MPKGVSSLTNKFFEKNGLGTATGDANLSPLWLQTMCVENLLSKSPCGCVGLTL